MGNNSTALKGLDSRFKQLGRDQNQLLSTLIVVQDDTTQEKMLIKQMNFANENDYNRIFKNIKQRKTLCQRKISKFLVRVKDVEGREQSQICGKTFRILVYLELLAGSLKSVLLQRKKTQRHFQEEELIKLCKTIVNGLIIFHDNNFKNMHLSKQSIVVTSQNVYKMLDTQLCNRIHPYFQVLNGVPTKEGTYLAPQLLQQARKGVNQYYPSPKADLFTLAVLVLELATFTSMDCHYNYDQKTVDIQALHQQVNQLNLSEQFKTCLHCMLQEHEEERVGLLSLRQLLNIRSDTQGNEELCAYSSVADITNRTKQSARTFISRSNRVSSQQKNDSPKNQVKKQKIGQIPSTTKAQPVINTHYLEGHNGVTRQFQSVNNKNEPMIVPFDSQRASSPKKNPTISFSHLPLGNQFSTCTPRAIQNPSFYSNEINKIQYDTPVQLMTKYQPESRLSTPIEHIVEEQSRLPKPIKPQQSKMMSKLTENISKTPSQLAYGSNDVFKNKTYGQISFGNGALYQGQFNSQGQFEGNGILYYPNGKICYSGSWHHNSFHGFGVLHNQNSAEDHTVQTNYRDFDWRVVKWLYYQGQFKNDRKEGFGTLYMANGDKFSGCFNEDAIEGFGSFYQAKQQKTINGIWVDNKLKH